MNKGACCEAWQPEFEPQDPHGGGKEPAPTSCFLVSTHIPLAYLCHILIKINKRNKSNF